jgi:hypothetical protein
MINDRVPINFPADVVDTVAERLDARDGSVGLCLLCGESFGEADIILGRPGYHNCHTTGDDRIRQAVRHDRRRDYHDDEIRFSA